MRSITIRSAAVLAAAALLAFAVLITPAFAENIQLNAPTTVSDDITRLHVDKFDADTHDYVPGAKMAIINEATGEVADSWVTDSTTHENEKGLDVDVVYILRELEAPEGYSKVSDVRFMVNATEGTGITVLSIGDDAELVESYKLSLYDKKLAAQQETVVTEPGSSTHTSSTSKTVAPKTGDEAPLINVAILVFVGMALIALLQIYKRRMDDSQQTP